MLFEGVLVVLSCALRPAIGGRLARAGQLDARMHVRADRRRGAALLGTRRAGGRNTVLYSTVCYITPEYTVTAVTQRRWRAA